MFLRWTKHPCRELEKNLGYTFKRKALLDTALTHRSYRFENEHVDEDNQRMEFLGDAALAFATAAYLYKKRADTDEGKMTSFRSQATSGKALSKIARDLELDRFVKVGRGEEKSGGRRRLSTLEDALEAVIGAAYLDGGLKAADKVFQKVFVPVIENLSGDVWAHNPKGKLQEVAQRKWGKGPLYRIAGKSGPAHAATFTVEVLLDGSVKGVGRGRNKQQAEARAAENVLLKEFGLQMGEQAERKRSRRQRGKRP